MEIKGGLAVTSWEQLVAAPAFAEGVRTLWWRRGEDGGFRIVAAQFRPGPTGLAADYLDRVSDQASAALETWRKAWEAAQLDAYMDAYTSDAVQQGRPGPPTSGGRRSSSGRGSSPRWCAFPACAWWWTARACGRT